MAPLRAEVASSTTPSYLPMPDDVVGHIGLTRSSNAFWAAVRNTASPHEGSIERYRYTYGEVVEPETVEDLPSDTDSSYVRRVGHMTIRSRARCLPWGLRKAAPGPGTYESLRGTSNAVARPPSTRTLETATPRRRRLWRARAHWSKAGPFDGHSVLWRSNRDVVAHNRAAVDVDPKSWGLLDLPRDWIEGSRRRVEVVNMGRDDEERAEDQHPNKRDDHTNAMTKSEGACHP